MFGEADLPMMQKLVIKMGFKPSVAPLQRPDFSLHYSVSSNYFISKILQEIVSKKEIFFFPHKI